MSRTSRKLWSLLIGDRLKERWCVDENSRQIVLEINGLPTVPFDRIRKFGLTKHASDRTQNITEALIRYQVDRYIESIFVLGMDRGQMHCLINIPEGNPYIELQIADAMSEIGEAYAIFPVQKEESI
jgi:hypothetical protein